MADPITNFAFDQVAERIPKPTALDRVIKASGAYQTQVNQASLNAARILGQQADIAQEQRNSVLGKTDKFLRGLGLDPLGSALNNDITRTLDGSLAQGIGGVIEGTGMALDAIGLDTVGQTIEGVGALARESGQKSLDMRDTPTQYAIEASTPRGSVLDPLNADFGSDPSVKGYGYQLLGILGEFAPQALALFAKGPIGVAIAASTGATQAGAAQGREAQQYVMDLSEKELNYSGSYRELLAQGLEPAEAQRQLATVAKTTALVTGGAIGGFSGGLLNKILKPVGTSFSKALSGGITRSGLARGAAGALEESLTESAETILSRAATNVLTDTNQDVGADTFADFILGGSFGGTVGGVSGAASGAVNNKVKAIQGALKETAASQLTNKEIKKIVEDGDITKLVDSDLPREQVFSSLVYLATNERSTPEQKQEAVEELAKLEEKVQGELNEAQAEFNAPIGETDVRAIERHEANIQEAEQIETNEENESTFANFIAEAKRKIANIVEKKPLKSKIENLTSEVDAIAAARSQASIEVDKEVESTSEALITALESDDITQIEREQTEKEVSRRLAVSPQSINLDDVKQLIESNKITSITADQIDKLRAARLRENKLKNADQVSGNIFGRNKELGYRSIPDYRSAVGAAISSGDKQAARTTLNTLRQFANSQSRKAIKAKEAFNKFTNSGKEQRIFAVRGAKGTGAVWHSIDAARPLPSTAITGSDLLINQKSKYFVGTLEKESTVVSDTYSQLIKAAANAFRGKIQSKVVSKKVASKKTASKKVAAKTASKKTSSKKVAAKVGKGLQGDAKADAVLKDLQDRIEAGNLPFEAIVDWVNTYGSSNHKNLVRAFWNLSYIKGLQVVGTDVKPAKDTEGNVYKPVGDFDVDTRTINLDLSALQSTGTTAVTKVMDTIVHEMAHAVTYNIVEFDSNFQAKIDRVRSDIRTFLANPDNAEVIKTFDLPTLEYALRNRHELIAVTLESPRTRYDLAQIKSTEKKSVLRTLMDGILNSILNIIKVKPADGSVLERILNLSEEAINTQRKADFETEKKLTDARKSIKPNTPKEAAAAAVAAKAAKDAAAAEVKQQQDFDEANEEDRPETPTPDQIAESAQEGSGVTRINRRPKKQLFIADTDSGHAAAKVNKYLDDQFGTDTIVDIDAVEPELTNKEWEAKIAKERAETEEQRLKELKQLETFLESEEVDTSEDPGNMFWWQNIGIPAIEGFQTDEEFENSNKLVSYFDAPGKTNLSRIRNFVTGILSRAAYNIDVIAPYITGKQKRIDKFKRKNHPERFIHMYMNHRNKWSKTIDELHKKGTPEKFYWIQPFNYFVDDDGNIEQHVKDAISFAALNLMLRNGNNLFYNTDERVIRSILGLKTSDEIPEDAEAEIFDKGSRQPNIINQLGNEVYTALGLETKIKVPGNEKSQIVSGLGGIALDVLLKEGYLERVAVPNTKLDKRARELTIIKNQGKKLNKEMKDYLERQSRITSWFIRSNKARDPETKERIDNPQLSKIMEVGKYSGSFLSDIFGVPVFDRAPTTEPVVSEQTEINRSDSTVPPKQLEVINQMNQQEYYLIDEYVGSKGIFTRHGREFFEAIAGLTDIDDSDSRVFWKHRKSNQAKNDKIKRSIQAIYDDTIIGILDGDVSQPLFIQHEAAIQGRIHAVSNGLNPQNDKVHRFVTQVGDWETEIDLNEGTNLLGFKLAVLEAFDVKTDTGTGISRAKEFDTLFEDPLITAALPIVQEMVKSPDFVADKEELAIIIEATQAKGSKATNPQVTAVDGTHAFAGLIALAKYQNAKQNGEDTFTVNLPREGDGKTNGPMIDIIQLGMQGNRNDPLFLALGGFYVEGSDFNDLGEFAEQVKLDLYKLVGKDIAETLAKASSNGQKDLVFHVLGDFMEVIDGQESVTGAARTQAKDPVTQILYGAAPGKIVRNSADKFLVKLERKITEESTRESAMEREITINMINGVLPPKHRITFDINTNYWDGKDFKFSLYQEELIKDAFKNTVGEAMKDSIDNRFGYFMEVRDSLSNVNHMTGQMYITMYNALKRRKLAENKAKTEAERGPVTFHNKGEKDENGKLILYKPDLTKEEDLEIREELAPMFPAIHTHLSKQSGNIQDGLFLLNIDSFKRSDDGSRMSEIHANNVPHNNAPPGDPANTTFTQMKNTATGRHYTGGGARSNVLQTQTVDAGTVVESIGDHNSINIFDAVITSIEDIAERIQGYNKGIHNILVNYSKPEEVLSAYFRVKDEFDKKAKEFENDPEFQEDVSWILPPENKQDEVTKQFSRVKYEGPLTDIDFIDQALRNGEQAHNNRLNMLAQIQWVSQFYVDGGNIEIPAEQRAEIAKTAENENFYEKIFDSKGLTFKSKGARTKAFNAWLKIYKKDDPGKELPDTPQDTDPEDTTSVEPLEGKELASFKRALARLNKAYQKMKVDLGKDIPLEKAVLDRLDLASATAVAWTQPKKQQEWLKLLNLHIDSVLASSSANAYPYIRKVNEAFIAFHKNNTKTQQTESAPPSTPALTPPASTPAPVTPAAANTPQEKILAQIAVIQAKKTKLLTHDSGKPKSIYTRTKEDDAKVHEYNQAIIELENSLDVLRAAEAAGPLPEEALDAINAELDRASEEFNRLPAPPQTTAPVKFSKDQVFDALNQDSPIEPSRAERLKGILHRIVNKLEDTATIDKYLIAATLGETPEELFAANIRDNNFPFFSRSRSNLQMTDAEGFVLEQVEMVVRESFDPNSAADKEILRVYKEAKKKLNSDGRDFHKGNWTNATAAQKAEAKSIHDFIFRLDTDVPGNSNHLSRFAALGLVYKPLSDALGFSINTSYKKPESGKLGDRLLAAFNMVVQWISNRLNNVSSGDPANRRLEKLVENLVRHEHNRKMQLQSKPAAVFDQIENTVDGAGKYVGKSVHAIATSKFVQGSPTSTNRYRKIAAGTGVVVGAVADNRAEALFQKLEESRNYAFKNKRFGFLSAVASEVRGQREDTGSIIKFLTTAKGIEQHRKSVLEATTQDTLAKFKNPEDITDAENGAVSQLYLRSGLSDLRDKYSIQEISDFVLSKGKRDTRIKILKDEILEKAPRILGMDYINDSKDLGKFLATGENRSNHLLKNAHSIVRQLGTHKIQAQHLSKGLTVQPQVDELISLYALSYAPESLVEAAKPLINRELARSEPNGLEFILDVHRRLQKQSLELLFSNNPTQMQKGYVREIFNPHNTVVAVTAAEGVELVKQGYEPLNEIPQDKDDPKYGKKRRFYVLKGVGMQSYETAAFSFSGKRASGTTVNSNSTANNPLALFKAKKREIAAIRHNKLIKRGSRSKLKDNYDPDRRPAGQLAPVLDPEGNVSNYQYLMTHKNQNLLMGRNNNFEHLLGNTASNQFDKKAAEEHNINVVKGLKEFYDADFANNPYGYLEFSANSKDEILQDAYRRLPESTKIAIREEWGSNAMYLRNDILDKITGYRNLSMSDPLGKDPESRGVAEKFLSYILGELLGAKAASKVRKGEHMWQETVKLIKDIRVIRNLSTLVGNVSSNTTALFLSGVPVKDILKGHFEAADGLLKYQKNEEELLRLENRIDTNTDQDKLQERIREIKFEMDRSPVKEMVDNGLFPSIVEDIDIESADPIFKSPFQEVTDKYLDKIPGKARKIFDIAAVNKNTQLHKFLSKSTQMSDFLARYVLYKHLKKNADKNNLTPEQIVTKTRELFVNYDDPTNRLLQYANSMGLVFFTKYYLRIQKQIFGLMRDHPSRALALAMSESYIHNIPSILDSSIITKGFGNPLYPGALEIFDAANEPIPIKLLFNMFD